MYIESKVAEFLEKNKDIYKYAVVSNADYFYVNKLPLECLKNIDENIIGTCHHWETSNMWTDGFYIGNSNTIIKIMNRINYYSFIISNIPSKNIVYPIALLVLLIFGYLNKRKTN